MLSLSNLRPAKGSLKTRKRIGRGQGSGLGGTSTKGHKGAKARTGYAKKVGFEGGQMPLQRRVPKFGFKNINRVAYQAVNLDDLQRVSEKYGINEITLDMYPQYGFSTTSDNIKILGDGQLTSALKIQANKFSAKAIAAIEAAGGTTTLIGV